MKKQTLKNLVLQKKMISNLQKLQKVNGGEDASWQETLKFCPRSIEIPQQPDPQPVPDSFIPVCNSKYEECPIL